MMHHHWYLVGGGRRIGAVDVFVRRDKIIRRYGYGGSWNTDCVASPVDVRCCSVDWRTGMVRDGPAPRTAHLATHRRRHVQCIADALHRTTQTRRTFVSRSDGRQLGPAASLFSYDRDTGIVSGIPSSLKEDDDGAQQQPQPQPLFQTVIGIEIHAQLSIPTKLFSSAPTKHHPSFSSSSYYSPKANENVAPHDLAYPGTLPRLSRSAVHAAVLSAAALNCTIHPVSRFERKHYAYADLPLGYQVTQQRWPIATDGKLVCRQWGSGNVGGTTQQDNDRTRGGKKRGRRRGRGGEGGGGGGSDDAAVAAAEIESTTTEATKSKGKRNEESTTEQPEEKFFAVGIERIQIEQDTGKTTTVVEENAGGRGGTITRSYIDLNRAGCALIEIVFRPDVRSAHQAASVVSTLQQILRHVGTCDGKMEEGSLRCDLNVSVAPLTTHHHERVDDDGATGGGDCVVGNDDDDDNPFRHSLPPGTGHRVEVKNLNSIRQIIAAAECESLRQSKAFVEGTPTARETRTYDTRSGRTVLIRTKGGAVDYRFMPEPDLPPLVLDEETLGGKTLDSFLAESLPELPEEATSRLIREYGVPEEVALVITADPPAISMYERAVEVAKQSFGPALGDVDKTQQKGPHQVPRSVANWMCNDLFALVKDSATKQTTTARNPLDIADDETAMNHPVSVEHSTVDGERLGSLVALVLKGVVSTTMGKKILTVMYNEDFDRGPREIAELRGWEVITDPARLRELCRSVVLDPKNEAQLDQYKMGGKYIRKIDKYFVGKVMAASKGNAHPELLLIELHSVLEEAAPGARD